MKQAHVVHVIVNHLRQTKEAPEKKTGERNSRKRSSCKVQRVKINMARQRAESSSFLKVNLYKMKENPTVTDSQRQREPKKNPFPKTGPLQMGTKVNHSDNNIDRPTQNITPNFVGAVDYLMKYTDLGMQSEQDQIDDGLLGDQEKEFDERKDSQPIWINADQNRSYQHRPSFSADTRICDEFKQTGACLLSGGRFVHMDEDASYPNLTR